MAQQSVDRQANGELKITIKTEEEDSFFDNTCKDNNVNKTVDPLATELRTDDVVKIKTETESDRASAKKFEVNSRENGNPASFVSVSHLHDGDGFNVLSTPGLKTVTEIRHSNSPVSVVEKRSVLNAKADELLRKKHPAGNIQHFRKLFKCKECGAGFTSNFSMQRHMWIHTDKKPFQCRYCGAKLSRKDKLKDHENRHVGMYKYKKRERSIKPSKSCGNCGKTFQLKILSLQCNHAGEKHDHVCELNTKKVTENFLTSSERHVGETKINQCCECGKCFSNKLLLADHISIVHRSFSFIMCNVCGYTSRSKSVSTRHQTLHHPNMDFDFSLFEASFCEECG
ncbi:zinc finger protein OZF-like [Clytia hemisphaerica]|uniref:C2H2-type domain-containing protein n=1 Tax=Clytia hemisphaerica TaxID=252671 RepID=A0A7M5UUL5_9CNID